MGQSRMVIKIGDCFHTHMVRASRTPDVVRTPKLSLLSLQKHLWHACAVRMPPTERGSRIREGETSNNDSTLNSPLLISLAVHSDMYSTQYVLQQIEDLGLLVRVAFVGDR